MSDEIVKNRPKKRVSRRAVARGPLYMDVSQADPGKHYHMPTEDEIPMYEDMGYVITDMTLDKNKHLQGAVGSGVLSEGLGNRGNRLVRTGFGSQERHVLMEISKDEYNEALKEMEEMRNELRKHKESSIKSEAQHKGHAFEYKEEAPIVETHEFTPRKR